jgi:hypothetical protein
VLLKLFLPYHIANVKRLWLYGFKNRGDRDMAKRIKWTRGILRDTWIAHFPEGDEREGEQWVFSRPSGGYVYCDMGRDDAPGTLGKQICYGGGLRGPTVYERDDDAFEKEVKKWLRQHRAVFA